MNTFLLTLPLLITLNAKNIIKEKNSYIDTQHGDYIMQL